MQPKDPCKQRMDVQLMEWNTQINLLAVKIEQVKTDLKLKYAREINEIRAKQREAARKTMDLKDASDAGGEKLKQTAYKIWKGLKTRMAPSLPRIR